jgi:GNAT superfamily N-acetyltransferase
MSHSIHVRELNDEAEYRQTWPVMWQLRPHLGADPSDENASEFIKQVIIQREEGYRLVAAFESDDVRAVAGFRIQHMLYRGRILYVDDLVTDASHRGKGVGRMLLQWLHEEAIRQGCKALHLDSGVHRHAAHAFYFARGMKIVAHHFDQELE